MGFDPCNCALKIRESILDSNSYNGSSLRSVKVHSFTFFALPGACDSRVFLLAHNLATPYFGRKPKARVATNTTNYILIY
jgi:hypothetical protein